VTERIVEEAAAAGVTMLWLQSGAESPHALLRARELGIETIAGGPCLLVEIDRLPE
jgi:predicted CoA-binding protein